jgi:cohesin loading factor subunit SCC2
MRPHYCPISKTLARYGVVFCGRLQFLIFSIQAEELTTSDYLLKIFRVAVPYMPKTAAKFGQELQAALQPMIIKPSGGGGVQIMQETVGCMCVVVQHLTHDFVRLINLMKSCNGTLFSPWTFYAFLTSCPIARLQHMLKRPSSQELGQNDVRALVMVIFIVALLAENCNFDNLRQEQQSVYADDVDFHR